VRFASLAALLALASCGHADPSVRDGGAVSSALWGGVFAAFPGARELCSQHVSGVGMHIQWTGYASARPVAEVVAFYEKNHGGHAVEREGGFRLRGAGDHVLSVHAKDGAYPRCEVAPAAGEATVIIVSQAIR
jgi:hypothetical protein